MSPKGKGLVSLRGKGLVSPRGKGLVTLKGQILSLNPKAKHKQAYYYIAKVVSS